MRLGLPGRLVGMLRSRRGQAAWPVDRRFDELRLAIGSLQARRAREAPSLNAAEFRAFSQWGEDGAIQWLIERVPIANEAFVEFGVEDYRESNTRFLLEHDNWRGLILDSGKAHARFITRSGLKWRHTIDARTVMVTAENIDDLLRGQPEDLGLLSVDIDGMDYWVLSAITVVRPRIVVCEYNALFGPSATVSVPYSPMFDRRRAHWSSLYFGASIAALSLWASKAGYSLIDSESHGANAFFVRNDVVGSLRTRTPEEAWREPRFRQARGQDGRLLYLGDRRAQIDLMADRPLVDVKTGATIRVGVAQLSAVPTHSVG